MSDECVSFQFDPLLSSSFPAAAEQSGKLHLGTPLSIVSCYDNYVIVQINLLPLVVTLIAAVDVNVQLLLNIRSEMSRLLEPVRSSVQQTNLQAMAHET